ncbi:MAG: hypothetical protein HN348_08270 [Proteobacteria bacterium]|nr:hypothetical protein [Pseudomonadota bacterium]
MTPDPGADKDLYTIVAILVVVSSNGANTSWLEYDAIIGGGEGAQVTLQGFGVGCMKPDEVEPVASAARFCDNRPDA